MKSILVFEAVLIALTSELRASATPQLDAELLGISLVQLHLQKKLSNSSDLNSSDLNSSDLNSSDLNSSDLNISDPSQPREISFNEVGNTIFPWTWHFFGHVGRAGRYCGSPHFPDINGDGFLDFFYHNHFKVDPISDWDFGINRGDLTRVPWYQNTSATTFLATEQGYHDIDTHGIAILDIDRDGVLDLYITVGGNSIGLPDGPDNSAWLMWGQNQKRADPVKFVGGRHMAKAAGVHNPDSRGRFTYFADLNNDGLLDMVFGNDVREDNENAYGYVVYNKGNRTFEPDLHLAEYANSMILTDADGDGHAAEFIVTRRNCLPSDHNPGLKPSKEVEEFCEDRVKGTAAIFKYSEKKGHMKQVAAEVANERDFQDLGVSMQTGDFDNDGKADLVVLRRARLTFYYSKSRKKGEWPLGSNMNEALIWDMHVCAGLGLRAADFDLDGKVELLVMCEEAGAHRLYRQTDNGWVHLKEGLGAIQSKSLPLLRNKFKDEACHFEGKLPYIEEFCSHLVKKTRLPVSTNGISVVDFNNDGYMDVVLAHDWGTLMVLANEGGSNRFLAIKLKGTVSNEYGIGATILLKVGGMGESGNDTVRMLREVNSASHETDWWGGRDDRIVFGLGPRGVPRQLTVRWPGKGLQRQTIKDPQILADSCNSMKEPLVIVEPPATKFIDFIYNYAQRYTYNGCIFVCAILFYF